MSDLRKDRIFRFPHFGGGLNKGSSPYKLTPFELRDMSNMNIDVEGALEPRTGSSRYEDATGSAPASQEHWAVGRVGPTLGMYRYGKMDGERELMIQVLGYVYTDNDTRIFTEKATMPQSDDGFVRFTQWRDTVFMHSTGGPMKTYHRGASTEVFNTKNMNGSGGFRAALWGNGVIQLVVSPTGGSSLETGKDYFWRFTLEFYHGDDFIGESYPLHSGVPLDSSSVPEKGFGFEEISYSPTPDQTTNHFLITRTDTTIYPNVSWPNGARYLNIYRTEAIDDATEISPGGTLTTPWKPYYSMFYVGRIKISDLDAASTGEVLFTEKGNTLDTSRKIDYQKREILPKPKFMTVHKNRMWSANAVQDWIKSGPNGVEESVPQRSGLYYSEYLKPVSMKYTSFIPIGEDDGEEITGLVSWRDKVLLVFKPNAIYAIVGNTKDLGGGVIDVELQSISEEVGCIAPETISIAEGRIIFLSNNGVMYYDGTVPKELDTKKIDPILKTIPPHRRSRAAGIYVNSKRQYVLAVSSYDADPGENGVVLKYDFFLNTWTRQRYGINEEIGYNKFVEEKRGDEFGRILAATRASVTAAGIHVLEDGQYEEVDDSSGVTWSADTGYTDCGFPEADKEFFALYVRANAPSAFTVTWNVDEAKATGTANFGPSSGRQWDGANVSWLGAAGEDTAHKWGVLRTLNRSFKLPATAKGKHISVKVSGQTNVPGIKITDIAVLWRPEKRVN